MSRARVCFVCCTVLALAGCSDPDKQVSRSTEDREFAVSLKAEKNWVYPGHSLPVQVRLESLGGPVQEDLDDKIVLIANSGTATPASLNVNLAGPDSVGNEAEQVFTGWVTFRASNQVTPENQGEIHALFQDAQATLKIRIVAPPGSL